MLAPPLLAPPLLAPPLLAPPAAWVVTAQPTPLPGQTLGVLPPTVMKAAKASAERRRATRLGHRRARSDFRAHSSATSPSLPDDDGKQSSSDSEYVPVSHDSNASSEDSDASSSDESSSDESSSDESSLDEHDPARVAVTSHSDPSVIYYVNLNKGTCTCPDHTFRGRDCKHQRELRRTSSV